MFGVGGRVVAGSGVRNDTAYTVTDSDAIAYLATLSTNSSTHDEAIDTLIIQLKSDGLWAKLDDFCVNALSQADSLKGLKLRRNAVVQGGSTTWSQGVGFNIPAGTANYIKTNLVANSAGGTFTNASNSMFFFRTGAETNPTYIMGFWDNGNFNFENYSVGSSASTIVLRLQADSGATGAAGSVSNFVCMSRLDASDVQSRVNGTTKTANDPAGDPMGTVFYPYIGSVNDNGNGAPAQGTTVKTEMAAWGVGGKLIAADQLNLDNAISQYMTDMSIT